MVAPRAVIDAAIGALPGSGDVAAFRELPYADLTR
jgi:hypothetical protein